MLKDRHVFFFLKSAKCIVTYLKDSNNERNITSYVKICDYTDDYIKSINPLTL